MKLEIIAKIIKKRIVFEFLQDRDQDLQSKALKVQKIVRKSKKKALLRYMQWAFALSKKEQ